MDKKRNIKPTQSELEILQILWEEETATVKEINEIVNKRKPAGYTTTLKTIQIMFEKGLVKREKVGRSHTYSAAIKKEETQQALLDKILDSAFGGSASNLVMQALGNKKTSKQELEEIKKMIKKLERDSE